LDLDGVLPVSNVRSSIFTWLLLTIHPQTERAIITRVAISDVRHNAVDTRAIVSGVRHDVSNTHVIVSDICRGVGTHTPSFLMFTTMFQIHVLSQTHAIVSDILQDTPKSQDEIALKDK